MADPELEEIKRARLAELQQGGAQGDQGAQRKQVEDERRSVILNQILEPQAVDRLNFIRLVKESRADKVETYLVNLARSGQLQQKITEEQLKDLLNAIAENERKGEEEQKVVVNRRKGGWDDDDDLLSGL